MFEVEIGKRLMAGMESAVEAHMTAAEAEGDYWFSFSDDWDININFDDSVIPSEFINAVAYPLINVGKSHKHIVTSVFALIKGDLLD